MYDLLSDLFTMSLLFSSMEQLVSLTKPPPLIRKPPPPLAFDRLHADPN